MDYLSPDNLYLCIDQGGHASRALVFDHEGTLVCSAFQAIEAHHTSHDYIEYPPDALVTSIATVIHEVLEKLGDRQSQISAAGMATQRSNVVCWNRETGEALSPVISWQDRRNNAMIRKLGDHRRNIHIKTGLFLSAHYGASKLRWCLENIPAVQHALEEGTLAYGPMASYLTCRFSEEKPALADIVNASRTLLVNLDTGNWDESLLRLFGLPAEPLPECVPSRHDFGRLAGASHIPLKVVTGDQSAAMYAYGPLQPDTAYINAGTGAFVSRPSGPSRIYGRRLLTSLIAREEDNSEYVLEGTVNGAGSAIDWFAHETGMLEIYDRLPDWLEQPTDNETFYLNGFAGLGAPFWVADFSSRFIGKKDNVRRAVAIVESIVFLLQASLDEMHKLASPPEQIQITGGLALLDGFCQRIADLSGLPVYRPVECEATGKGLAYLLAGRPHHWPEETPGDWFEPRANPALKRAYVTWTGRMLEAMRGKEKEFAAE